MHCWQTWTCVDALVVDREHYTGHLANVLNRGYLHLRAFECYYGRIDLQELISTSLVISCQHHFVASE